MTVKSIISVGRSSECTYQLTSPTVSSKHALILISETNQLLIIDQDSANGTRIATSEGWSTIQQSAVDASNEVYFGDMKCRIGDIVGNIEVSVAESADQDYTTARNPSSGKLERVSRASTSNTLSDATQPTKLTTSVLRFQAVDFFEAIRLFFTNYFVFEGRSSRRAYWLVIFGYLVISVVSSAFDAFLFPELLYGLFAPLLMVATIIPNLALNVRRLHDVNRSGMWLFLHLTVVGSFVLLYWVCQKGDSEKNNFGEAVEAGRT